MTIFNKIKEFFKKHKLSSNQRTRVGIIGCLVLASAGLYGCGDSTVITIQLTGMASQIEGRLSANLNIAATLAGKDTSSGETILKLGSDEDVKAGVGAILSESDYQTIVDSIQTVENFYGIKEAASSSAEDLDSAKLTSLAAFVYQFRPITPGYLIKHEGESAATKVATEVDDNGAATKYQWRITASANANDDDYGKQIDQDLNLSDTFDPGADPNIYSADDAFGGDGTSGAGKNDDGFFSATDYLIHNSSYMLDAKVVGGSSSGAESYLDSTEIEDTPVYQYDSYTYISIVGNQKFNNSGKGQDPDAGKTDEVVSAINDGFNFTIYVLNPAKFTREDQQGIDGLYAMFRDSGFITVQSGAINGIISNYFNMATGEDKDGNVVTNIKLFSDENKEVGDKYKLIRYDDPSVLGNNLGGSREDYLEYNSKPGNPLVYYEYGMPAMAVMFMEFDQDTVDLYEQIIGSQTGKWLLISTNGYNNAYLLQYPVSVVTGLEQESDGRIKAILAQSDNMEVNVCTGKIIKTWNDGNEKAIDTETYYRVGGAENDSEQSLASFIVSGYTTCTVQVYNLNKDTSLTNTDIDVYAGRIVLRDYLEGMYAPGAVQDSPDEKLVCLGRMIRLNLKFESLDPNAVSVDTTSDTATTTSKANKPLSGADYRTADIVQASVIGAFNIDKDTSKTKLDNTVDNATNTTLVADAVSSTSGTGDFSNLSPLSPNITGLTGDFSNLSTNSTEVENFDEMQDSLFKQSVGNAVASCYGNKTFKNFTSVDKDVLTYLVIGSSDGYDKLSLTDQLRVIKSLGWSSAADAETKRIKSAAITLDAEATLIELYKAVKSVYNSPITENELKSGSVFMPSYDNDKAANAAIAARKLIDTRIKNSSDTKDIDKQSSEMAMQLSASGINTDPDTLSHLTNIDGGTVYNTAAFWNRDDPIGYYIGTDGNKIDQFGDIHVYDIMDAKEIINNNKVKYFTESTVQSFQTDETSDPSTNSTSSAEKAKKLNQLATTGYGTDAAAGTQIMCTAEMPSSTIDAVDYAKDKDYTTQISTVQRFYVIAVKGDLFQRQLFSNWIDVQSDTNCLDWWNKYLASCGMNYNVSHQNINDWLTNNYAYEMSQNGIVILDLNTVGWIQRMYDAEQSNSVAVKLRTIFMILGYILIAYAAVLLLCWTLDVNVGLNVGLLEKATFGHWIAVKYKSDVPAKDSERRSYVYGSSMLIRFVLMIIVAIIMINFNVFRLVIVFVKVFGKLAEHIQNVLQGN